MFYLATLFVFCVSVMFLDAKMIKPGDIHSNKDQKVLDIFIVCLLIWFAGLRNVGGTDFYIYANVYERVPKLSKFFEYYDVIYDKYSVYGHDKGYLFINSLFKTIGFTYYGYNFIHSLFVISMIYFGTRKYTNNFGMVVMIILYKMFFYDFCVSLRQTITIAIFLGMLSDIEKKHWIRYYILCGISYCIHAASIVLFVVYFIRYIKLSQKVIMLLNAVFIPTLLLSVFDIPVLNIFRGILELDIFSSEQILDKATNLLTAEAASDINWLHTAEYFGIMFFLTWFYDDITEEFPHSDRMIKLFLCLLPVFTLFRNYEILTRVKDYFTISYGFILSYLCGIREKKYQNTILVIIIIWCGWGYFRYINLFDNGIFKYYMPISKYGVEFFSK